MSGWGGGLAGSASGDGAVKIQREIDTVVDRIQAAQNDAMEAVRSATRIADRLYGEVPEPALKGGGPATPGSMSLLQAALDGLDETVRLVNYQIGRLDGL